MADETRYCHAFKQIPQVKIHMKEGQYQQAEMRMFGAAQIPVDNLRYMEDNNTQKMLRSTSKARNLQKRETMASVQARL